MGLLKVIVSFFQKVKRSPSNAIEAGFRWTKKLIKEYLTFETIWDTEAQLKYVTRFHRNYFLTSDVGFQRSTKLRLHSLCRPQGGQMILRGDLNFFAKEQGGMSRLFITGRGGVPIFKFNRSL